VRLRKYKVARKQLLELDLGVEYKGGIIIEVDRLRCFVIVEIPA
jgi:hypothetical protein